MVGRSLSAAAIVRLRWAGVNGSKRGRQREPRATQGARGRGDFVSSLRQGSGQVTHHLRTAPSRVEDDPHQDSENACALGGWRQDYSTPRGTPPPALDSSGPRSCVG